MSCSRTQHSDAGEARSRLRSHQRAFQREQKADEKIAQDGLIFIKLVWQHINYNFLQHNWAKTAFSSFMHVLISF